jgi:predicted dehydrogenase
MSDYRQVLARKDVDAVLIATPPHTHSAIVRDALQAGKHVFCESVLVLRPAEIESMRALSRDLPRLVIQAGFQRRYSYFYQAAQAMAAKGFLGTVTHIQTHWHRNAGWLAPGAPGQWEYHRATSAGLAGGVTSHQIDFASWVFGETPESVTGAGSLDWRRDGRDTFDNIHLLFRYPGGQTLYCAALTTNNHVGLLAGRARESAEIIHGTDGAIEISLGTADQPCQALWYLEPAPRSSVTGGETEKPAFAGASIPKSGRVVWPLLPRRDQITGKESFLEKEAKFARRWMYEKGIMLPEEERHPADEQLLGFFESCRSGRRPRAHLEAGLENAATVMLANIALDEGRRVGFSEFEKLVRRRS